jgi:glycosyltransferase involved in cell wall biosynthesis
LVGTRIRTLVCFSATREEAAGLDTSGPRRDIRLLIDKADADVLYRASVSRRKGFLGKVAGPQIRHAWQAAGRAPMYEVIFADGEHVGLPLLFFMAARRRRQTNVVMLCHYVDKPWKRWLIRWGTRLIPRGTLLCHSVVQMEVASRAASAGWSVRIVPYQVDTNFWQAPAHESQQRIRPLVVAVGSENRDYDTLCLAVTGLNVDVRIAAGSHWARKTASIQERPPNVEYVSSALPFAELRELYAQADIVVVPLNDVSNQSGVTTLLEAMSMGVPVIVTATAGQREVVKGPLVTVNGLDAETTADRGPIVFGLDNPTQTGYYVPVADAAAVREAVRRLAEDNSARALMGAAGRAVARDLFTVEQFAERVSSEISMSCRKPRTTHFA